MTLLAFAPLHNSPGKKDATGAFQPEAREWLSFEPFPHSELVLIDNHLSAQAMRDAVIRAILDHAADTVAFFCHGWKTGIQFGFGMQHLDALAQAIAYTPSQGMNLPVVNVVLYACSTADGAGPGGDGGFADGLRDALCRAGAVYCHVDAHDRPGHTTKNPYVRRFDGQGSRVGGTGGSWIVAPGSELWGRWRRALQGDLRFRFPTMTVAEIHDELSRGV